MTPDDPTAGAPVAGGPPPQRRIGSWLRITVSVVLLAVLISRVDLSNALPQQRHLSTLLWLAGAFGCALGGVVLSAWRWERVLLVFDREVRLRTLVAHYFSGQFVGNVLPSTIGGDVVRVSRLTRTIGDAPTAFGSVALERLTGFIALPVLSLIGFAIDPSLLGADRSWIALLASAITITALGAIVFLAGHPRLAGRFRHDEGWTRFIGAVHVGVERMRREPRRAAAALGTAMLYQASLVVTMWCVAHALDAPVPTAALLAYIPAVAMAQVLPLSLAGLGVREGMLVLLLTPLGVTTGQAVGIGLLWYLIMLVVSMFGAPSFAVGSRHRVEESAVP
ncbi:MAG: lysylphosphatidylglycerol synthase transmembrane domain-containing protein [Actinomycetes bacterium]